MNIWDLKIGDKGRSKHGTVYTVIRDTQERLPGYGEVPIRVTRDEDGNVQKFFRGIEVTPV